ncbi:hypothetical protein [Acholeplasma hippikon]|uniref:Uncharacterized protein n=1 Tax=Acholeplasma hippikon TaxID=264636 RepID=A0A449BLD7_9MOLU|nr:hypothetical protein [Acholeplasma hippikon]VEU83245.1 Uncharacterised protein [Acholeplasma hippikon]
MKKYILPLIIAWALIASAIGISYAYLNNYKKDDFNFNLELAPYTSSNITITNSFIRDNGTVKPITNGFKIDDDPEYYHVVFSLEVTPSEGVTFSGNESLIATVQFENATLNSLFTPIIVNTVTKVGNKYVGDVTIKFQVITPITNQTQLTALTNTVNAALATGENKININFSFQ